MLPTPLQVFVFLLLVAIFVVIYLALKGAGK